MSRLILHLSGVLSDSDLSFVNKTDICSYLGGLEKTYDRATWVELSSKQIQSQRLDCCKVLVSLISENQGDFFQSMISSFVNDYYSYTVGPLAAALAHISLLIEENNINEVILIATNSTSTRLPMFGFRTQELQKGSRNILGNHLTRIILESQNFVPNVRFHKAKGDLFSIEFLRRLALRLGGALFLFLFFTKVLIQSIFAPTTRPPTQKCAGVLVRVSHHIRFSKLISQKLSPSKIVVFPQIALGSYASHFKLLKEIKKYGSISKIGVLSLLKAFVEGLRDTKKIRSIKSTKKCINVGSFSFSVSLEHIAREVSYFPGYFVYARALRSMLVQNKIVHLVNFEVEGAFAGLESTVCNSLGTRHSTIQTVLVQPETVPIFPKSQDFYCIDEPSKTSLQNKGLIKSGVVKYAGPPCVLVPVQSYKHIYKIGFFTQPYETEVTVEIIETLCSSLEQNQLLVLRIHPRDRIENYTQVIKRFRDKIEVDTNSSILDCLKGLQICVTRTSSVAGESILLGCPIVLCHMTKRDTQVEATYIQTGKDWSYIVHDCDNLKRLILSPESLFGDAVRLQKLMYKSKNFSDLLDALSSDRSYEA